MFWYKVSLEFFFYGLIVVGLLLILLDIYNHYNNKRREKIHRTKRTLRLIKYWY